MVVLDGSGAWNIDTGSFALFSGAARQGGQLAGRGDTAPFRSALQSPLCRPSFPRAGRSVAGFIDREPTSAEPNRASASRFVVVVVASRVRIRALRAVDTKPQMGGALKSSQHPFGPRRWSSLQTTTKSDDLSTKLFTKLIMAK